MNAVMYTVMCVVIIYTPFPHSLFLSTFSIYASLYLPLTD
jgi:hypothetical protein